MDEHLLRFKKDQKYLVFDYETCNLNLGLDSNKPWQLGFLTCKGNRILEKFDALDDKSDEFYFKGFILKKNEKI